MSSHSTIATGLLSWSIANISEGCGSPVTPIRGHGGGAGRRQGALAAERFGSVATHQARGPGGTRPGDPPEISHGKPVSSMFYLFLPIRNKG